MVIFGDTLLMMLTVKHKTDQFYLCGPGQITSPGHIGVAPRTFLRPFTSPSTTVGLPLVAYIQGKHMLCIQVCYPPSQVKTHQTQGDFLGLGLRWKALHVQLLRRNFIPSKSPLLNPPIIRHGVNLV